jgi:hypothetical protein
MALGVIFLVYFGIGILAALGVIVITRKQVTPSREPVVYGLVLIPIAAIYLAFSAYFEASAGWRNEGLAVGVFALLGLVGIRLPLVLILAYILHGAWDVLHEVTTLTGAPQAASSTLTAIPLAYGAFCAAYDWFSAGYFYTRRAHWVAARTSPAA